MSADAILDSAATGTPALDVAAIRERFPILAETVSRLNTMPQSGGAIEVKVTASVFDDAQRVAALGHVVEVDQLLQSPSTFAPLS